MLNKKQTADLKWQEKEKQQIDSDTNDNNINRK